MAETDYFPRRLIPRAPFISGVLMALAVHSWGWAMADIGGPVAIAIPANSCHAGAAIAWWLIASVGFCGGIHATRCDSASVEGKFRTDAAVRSA